MKVHIVSLFPSLVEAYFFTSIIGRARDANLIEVNIVNPRDFVHDKYKTCDDEPYGGGYGMILKAEPLAAALDSILIQKREQSYQESDMQQRPLVLFPTPVAPLFTQSDAQVLSLERELIFICGKYEGIDQRIIDLYVDKVFSIGEYILSSGEIASMVILDATLRLITGIIREESLHDESYFQNLLEYPQYTRPAEFKGISVPDILLSGNHKKIAQWREEQKKIRTKKYRPDLFSLAIDKKKIY